jgi:hypothetical protein
VEEICSGKKYGMECRVMVEYNVWMSVKAAESNHGCAVEFLLLHKRRLDG